MGVKGLIKLINDVSKNKAIKTYDFEHFKGMSVAVDASLMIHQTVVAIRSSGKDMTNKKGEMTSHIHGLFFKILALLQNEMIPIFVFDGKALDIKTNTLKLRKEKREKSQLNVDKEEITEDEYIKHFKQTYHILNEHIEEIKILLNLMGIPYIVAPNEADVVCAWLSQRDNISGDKYVDGVCSDDSDIITIGASNLFKDMVKFMKKGKQVKVVNLERVLKKMELTMEQFVNLCSLLDNDYCTHLPRIGPKRAYTLVSQNNNIEKIFTVLKLNKNDENLKCMISARNYFKNALKELDDKNYTVTTEQTTLRNFQSKELLDYLCIKHNFETIKVKNGIERLEKYYKIMDVNKPNLKTYHKIIQPDIEKYINIDPYEIVTSDDEVVIPQKNKKKKYISKKLNK